MWTSFDGTFPLCPPISNIQMPCEASALVERGSGPKPQVIAALLSLNFFMADIQAGRVLVRSWAYICGPMAGKAA